jgi:acyl-CoA thioester hydrolase
MTMLPKPFLPQPTNGDPCWVRDAQTGLVWHRVGGRVLSADTDRSGVVYHANYLRYFEIGRASLMRTLHHPYREVEAQGTIYPIIEMGVRFHHPLFYDDRFWVHARPGLIERVRVHFDYVMTHAETGDQICSGSTSHCATSIRRRPVAVDPSTVELWRTFPT